MSGIKRQQVQARDDFTYDERQHIAEKSDNKCCHCGREVYFGYGATVDHFIPLSEGGVNRDINMIMLCQNCNKEKKSKILEPTLYLKYLKEEHKKKLIDYFHSYVRSFDFFSKRNVMACDEYEFQFYPENMGSSHKLKNNKFKKRKIDINNKKRPTLFSVKLKRATGDDFDKILEYYTKYLKKHDFFKSDIIARNDISLFLKYGCIYYVEKTDGIKAMCFVSIERDTYGCYYKDIETNYGLSIFIMPYYSNDVAHNMAYLLCKQIPGSIFMEQGLKCVFAKIRTLQSEKFFEGGIYPGIMKNMRIESPFMVHPIAVGVGEEDTTEKDIKKTDKFFENNHPDYNKIIEDIKTMYGEDWVKDDDAPPIYRLFDADYGNGDLGFRMAKAEMRKTGGGRK